MLILPLLLPLAPARVGSYGIPARTYKNYFALLILKIDIFVKPKRNKIRSFLNGLRYNFLNRVLVLLHHTITVSCNTKTTTTILLVKIQKIQLHR